MINNKEKIKAKMKEELYRAVDKFVDEMDAESNKADDGENCILCTKPNM